MGVIKLLYYCEKKVKKGKNGEILSLLMPFFHSIGKEKTFSISIDVAKGFSRAPKSRMLSKIYIPFIKN